MCIDTLSEFRDLLNPFDLRLHSIRTCFDSEAVPGILRCPAIFPADPNIDCTGISWCLLGFLARALIAPPGSFAQHAGNALGPFHLHAVCILCPVGWRASRLASVRESKPYRRSDSTVLMKAFNTYQNIIVMSSTKA